MRKIILCFLILLSVNLFDSMSRKEKKVELEKTALSQDQGKWLYEQMDLDGLICLDAFKSAYTGYKKLNKGNNPLLTLIDFSLPSTEKRMYVLDLAKKEILFVSYVSHGRNSGQNYATSFSNRDGSHQSSLGFYRTVDTYNGGNGYSLRLDGLEKGINDKAMQRAIVIHGADYCSENAIRSTGRLGRSFGCPAIPRELAKPIIDTIKGGSLLFIYADQPEYLASSKVLEEDQILTGKNILSARNNTPTRSFSSSLAGS
ncbi:L,D-transpeptidase catalytic domain [Porphyromonadaceae bacterium KH3R12]|nr:L,D-transpeptidase catalytic domain [Porphyromonadaceae bacterium KH3R12]